MTNYRSGHEKKVADLMDNLGVTYEYESTIDYIPYDEMVNITKPESYPDDVFWVSLSGIFLECKGYWDPVKQPRHSCLRM